MTKTPTEIKSLARFHSKASIETLDGIMNNPNSPAASRVAAAQALLDRGWGKAPQTIEGDISQRHVFVIPPEAESVEEWLATCTPKKIESY